MKANEKNNSILESPTATLNYRNCLNYINYFLIFLFLACTTLFVISLVGFFYSKGSTDHRTAMSLIVNAGFFGMFSALFFSLRKFHLKPVLMANIKLFKDSLLFSDTQREYSIYFEDLDKVEFISFMGFSRLVLKTKDHDVFSYSMWIKNIEMILDAIYKFDHNLIKKDQYVPTRNDIVLSGHNMARLESFFGSAKLLKTAAHLLLIPGVLFLILLWKQSGVMVYSKIDYYLSSVQPFLLIVMVTTSLYFIISNILITGFIKKKELDSTHVDLRDDEYEKGVFKKLYPWYMSSLVVLVALVISLDLNFYSIFMVKHSSVPLNLLKGERFWVDKRYNCVGCKYELKENDIIVYINDNKKEFAKVLGVKTIDQRVPASGSQLKPIRIISSKTGQGSEISLNQIIGKKL